MLINACKTLFLWEEIAEPFSFCSHANRDFRLVLYQVSAHNRPLYIETVPNRHARPTLLLREAWREGPHGRKRTLAHLTHWPAPKIDALRLLLQAVPLGPLHSLFVVARSLPHGAVEAIVGTMRQFGLANLLASKPCRERQLVLAMLAARLLHPSSQLGPTRLWHTPTLAEELGGATANEDDLSAAMDWLLARQARIEQQLAKRHLSTGSHVLYDGTSSYYEGSTCPLARFGYNRDQPAGHHEHGLWRVDGARWPADRGGGVSREDCRSDDDPRPGSQAAYALPLGAGDFRGGSRNTHADPNRLPETGPWFGLDGRVALQRSASWSTPIRWTWHGWPMSRWRSLPLPHALASGWLPVTTP